MKRIIYLFLMILVSCVHIPKGVNSKHILIKSKPTKAKIYVNDEYIGVTPVCTKLWYEKDKFVNIKAEPIFPNQFPQNIYFKIPPIPPKLVIYMDYQAKEKYDVFEEQKKKEEMLPEVVLEIMVESEKDVEIQIVEVIKIVKEHVNLLLPTIYFETDKFDVANEDIAKLVEVVKILNDNPQFHLTIHAHTDERGTVEYNRKLSHKRAVAVQKELVQMEIPEARMSIMVHGERIIYNGKEEKIEFGYNRSVDFSIDEGSKDGRQDD